MANTGIPQTPREMRYGLTIQSVFGTAELDSVAVTELDCTNFNVNRDIKEFIIEGAHGSRQQAASDVIVRAKELMPSFTVECHLKREELVLWFSMLTQNVIEGLTPEFEDTHTFLDGQPDFDTNAGYFSTWWERDPEASKSIAVKDVVMKAMTLTVSGDEPMKASMEFVGLGATVDTANPTGSWTINPVTNLFYRSDVDMCEVTLTAGAKDFHLHELELSFSREIVGYGNDGSGGFTNYALTKPENKFKLMVPKLKAGDWSNVLSDQALGTEIDLRIGWGGATPGDALGDLDFQIHGKLDGPSGAEKEYDDMIFGVMTGRMLKSGATESITIIHADGVDTSWI